jgi:lipoprotein-anchoring transpeptidase ErfK/SrfK
MRSLGLFCGAAALLLGSATPPPLQRPAEATARPVAAPVLPEPVDALELLALEPVPWPAAPEQAAAPQPTAPQPAWTPPPAAAVRVIVSIPRQKAFVYRGGTLVATSPVSTGKRGHETPVGTFRIIQKAVRHRSNIYANAPMPYMQKITHYGVALHAGHLPGYPASHGCIRLPWGFARKLYGMTDGSTRVTVTRAKPKWVGGKPVFG